ncbi:glycosyltransferase family 4 protein [Rubrolithibacter danxiaensis]|uniref:glycosyltransferase family 4 protein n=1 Tax=Rubrolithibacter danxiaensis TaxID=3390805 RepID=UPI003BF7E554
MQILIITKNYPPTVDGVGDYSFQLQKALRTCNNTFEFYIATSKSKECTELEGKFFYFQHWNKNEFKLLKNFIKEKSISVVLVQYVPYSYHKLGVPFKLVSLISDLGLNLITVFHEVRIKLIPWRKNFIIGLGQLLCARVLYNRSKYIITSNFHYKKLISDKDSYNKIRVIPVGSNLSSDEKNRIIKSEASKSKFVITSFGQSIRCWRTILNASSKLLNDIPSLQVLLIGALPEDDKRWINAEAKKLNIDHIVKVTGKISAISVHQLLKECDLYLMLENFSYNNWTGTSFRSGSLAAALEAHLPVIGNEGELTNPGIQNCEGIILLKTTTVDSLVDAILNFYCLSDQQKKERKKSIESLFKTEISWNAIAKSYLEVISSAVSC